jgi:hypothetical protein
MIAEITATRERLHSRALQLQMQESGNFHLSEISRTRLNNLASIVAG